MLRKNPFVHTFHKGNNVALFNALTLSTVYLSKTQYESVVKNPPKPFIEDKLFVSEDFNAINYLQKFSKKSLKDSNINTAFFLVTTGCNLSCDYCFEKSSQHQQIQMSEEIAEKGVALLTRNTDKLNGITFYGGEPLLNFKAIKKIISSAKKLGLKCDQFQLITNGCLIDEKIAKFIKDNNIFTTISLDGDKDINDKARKDSKGMGAFEKTLEGMKILNKKQVPFGVSCTVGNHNFDHLNSISKILKKFNIKNLEFAFVTENKGMIIEKETSDLMLKNSIKTAEKWLKEGIVESKIAKKVLRSFIKGQNRFRECAAYGEQIVIAPNGKVGTCSSNYWLDNKETNTYFDLDVNYTGKIKEHPTWIEWSNRTPLNMPQCFNCFGIGLCGGGCASNSLVIKGSIWEVNKLSCTLTKEILPWAIWKYYESKNLAKSKRQGENVT